MLEISKVSANELKISGRFDASQVEKAEAELKEFSSSTTLDCAELDYISSAGLGVLVATFHRLATSGDRLTLANVNNHIRDITKSYRRWSKTEGVPGDQGGAAIWVFAL